MLIFSGARRGNKGAPGGPLRSKATPMGVEGLSAIDAGEVVLGNKMLAVTTPLVALCRSHGVPVTVENPRRSRLWWTPGMLRTPSKGCRKLNLDFCAYGTSLMKSTTFAAWGTSIFDDIARTCHMRPPDFACSFSGQRHHRLQGTAPGGQCWTPVAQPYPKRLVALYAKCATDRMDTSKWHQAAISLAHKVHCG